MKRAPLPSKSSRSKEKQRASGASSQARHGGRITEPKPSCGANTDISKQSNRDSRYRSHPDQGNGSLRGQEGSVISEHSRNISNGSHSSDHEVPFLESRPSNHGVAAVDSCQPLSSLGKEFLEIDNGAYVQCHRFLTRHSKLSKLDFNHNQILLAAHQAPTPEAAEKMVKKALLLFQWEHRDPESASKYFQNLNDSKSREYVKFHTRVKSTMDKVNCKRTVDEMPVQESRIMSREGFLVPGRVIAVYGQGSDNEETGVDSNRNNYEHEFPRYLVVIKTQSRSEWCLCAPIVSSNGQRPGSPVSSPDISRHAAIICAEEDVKTDRFQSEPKLPKRLITVKLAQGACLPMASRLCFHRSETIWRLLRVEDIGMVTPNCIPLLEKYLHESVRNPNPSEGT